MKNQVYVVTGNVLVAFHTEVEASSAEEARELVEAMNPINLVNPMGSYETEVHDVQQTEFLPQTREEI